MDKLDFTSIQCRCALCVNKAIQIAEQESGEKINYIMFNISEAHESNLRHKLGMLDKPLEDIA